MTNEERVKTYRRWKSYVKNKPNKYRIVHRFRKSYHLTELQQSCNDIDFSGVRTIEQMKKWVFELAWEIPSSKEIA